MCRRRKDRRIVPADCTEPKQFPRDKLGSFVAELYRRRRLMVDGIQQDGKPTEKLKKGESVMEVEWSCDLEEKAIAALNTMECPEHRTQCPTYPPSNKDGPSEIPNGTTGFFDCQNFERGYEPMGNWLSEMDKNGIDQDLNPKLDTVVYQKQIDAVFLSMPEEAICCNTLLCNFSHQLCIMADVI
ncbi:hypothetical protein ANCCAN_22181 [Ancylostoma caninum]|uniref:SCP domain-containing protein n=1 Tax=Ancylostoma caninum TaxID=29170 RepID=A0A368FIR6_ANCCA|nr:hypothetical protein ANCCAN_22181 [Ancylostoma caninum]